MAKPPLDPVYAVLFIDAINVKIREGQVANRPIYLALGVTVDGERDVLDDGPGSTATGKERILAAGLVGDQEPRCAGCVHAGCDGLKGLPDAVSTVWEKTIVQTCIVHLLRNSFKYASKRDWANRERSQARLHRGVRSGSAGQVRRFLREVGETLPGYYTAVGERVGGVRTIPGLRPGNKDRHMHHQRHRIHQCQATPRRERPRPFPHRARCTQMPVPGDHEPGRDDDRRRVPFW